MPTPIPKNRMPTLKAALAKYKPAEKESMRALAKLYGVAASRFSTLIKDRFPDFPAAERIDKADYYPARAAIESMIQYMVEQKRGARSSAGKRAAAIRGAATSKVDREDPADEPMTPTELDKLASAMTRTFNLQKLRGEVVDRAVVKARMRSAFSIFSHEVMGIPNLLDPNGQMEEKQRTTLEHKCREILTKVHNEMGNLLDLNSEAGTPATAPATGRNRRT